MGPWDYLDLFRAGGIDDASKVSTLVRSFGHAHTEIWPLTEWSYFKDLVRGLGARKPTEDSEAIEAAW